MTSPRVRNATEELALPREDDDQESTKELISTVLDTVAMMAVALGVGWGLVLLLGPWGIALGGVALFVLNALAGIARRPAPEPEPEPEQPPPPPPGPEDAGTLHVSGR